MSARFSLIAAVIAWGGATQPPAAAQSGEQEVVRLSVDGRLRYEVVDPASFGTGPQDPGGYVLWRVAPRLDVGNAPGIRARIQLFAANIEGREGGARRNDRNDLDLTQAFIEWRPADGRFVRAGRQEIALGSGRLLAALDGANIRRRFDGLHSQWTMGTWTLVGVAASPVLVRPGTLDDESSAGRLAIGGGIIQGESGRNSQGIYLIQTESAEGGFGAPPGAQERNTAGVRIVRTGGRTFGEIELLQQWGKTHSGDEIEACAVAGEIRVTPAQVNGANLVLGTKVSLASGDEDPGDAVLGGFDPLFPNPGFTGSFPIFAPTNLATVNPSISFQWRDGHRVGLDVAFLERVERSDRAYAPSGIALPAQGEEKHIGALWAVTGARQLTGNVSLTATFFWLDQAGSLPASADDARGAFVNLNFSY